MALGVVAVLNVIAEVFPPDGAPVQVHKPVPTVGVFPPKPRVVFPLHVVIFPPLVEEVGGAIIVTAVVAAVLEHKLLSVTIRE